MELKPLLTDGYVRQIVLAVATGEFISSQLQDQFKSEYSAGTIRRILASVGWIVYTKMERTLPLTPQHIATRQEWARERIGRRHIGVCRLLNEKSSILMAQMTSSSTGGTSISPQSKPFDAKTAVTLSWCGRLHREGQDEARSAEGRAKLRPLCVHCV